MVKTSLDGHWRGPIVVSQAMRDAGMEVIFGGALKPREIAETAIQEDVDVIGLHVGGRYGQIKDLMSILKEKKVDDKLIIAGGTVPPDDIAVLKEMGIAEVFPPGSTLDSIVEYIKKSVAKR